MYLHLIKIIIVLTHNWEPCQSEPRSLTFINTTTTTTLQLCQQMAQSKTRPEEYLLADVQNVSTCITTSKNLNELEKTLKMVDGQGRSDNGGWQQTKLYLAQTM